MKTEELEYWIYKYFIKQNTYMAVIPRVYKKFKIHECDLIVIHKSEHIYEIELKTTVGDCKADLNKEHEHKDIHNRLKYQYFGVPKSIVHQCKEYIPENFGILTVDDSEDESYRGEVKVFRKAVLNKTCRKITKGELINLLTTGCHRYFGLIENKLKTESEDEC